VKRRQPAQGKSNKDFCAQAWEMAGELMSSTLTAEGNTYHFDLEAIAALVAARPVCEAIMKAYLYGICRHCYWCIDQSSNQNRLNKDPFRLVAFNFVKPWTRTSSAGQSQGTTTCPHCPVPPLFCGVKQQHCEALAAALTREIQPGDPLTTGECYWLRYCLVWRGKNFFASPTGEEVLQWGDIGYEIIALYLSHWQTAPRLMELWGFTHARLMWIVRTSCAWRGQPIASAVQVVGAALRKAGVTVCDTAAMLQRLGPLGYRAPASTVTRPTLPAELLRDVLMLKKRPLSEAEVNINQRHEGAVATVYTTTDAFERRASGGLNHHLYPATVAAEKNYKCFARLKCVLRSKAQRLTNYICSGTKTLLSSSLRKNHESNNCWVYQQLLQSIWELQDFHDREGLFLPEVTADNIAVPSGDESCLVFLM
jgi:hypothetical protein